MPILPRLPRRSGDAALPPTDAELGPAAGAADDGAADGAPALADDGARAGARVGAASRAGDGAAGGGRRVVSGVALVADVDAPAAVEGATGPDPGLDPDPAPVVPELPEPPPADRWAADVLGAGFVARTLPLHEDDEGDVVATLVRHVPAEDPRSDPAPTPTFTVLYLHGWNDYFNQRELAREWSALGGAFYGLDLRKYGRSLRVHHTRGYVDSLSVYDEDIHAALAVIRAEHGADQPLVLMGHSTGGLTAALWAHRHPGALRALVLNSPWLELQGSSLMRTLSQPVVDRLARYQPKAVLPLIDLGHYARTLAGMATDSDSDVPADDADDPFVVGWGLEPAWRLPSASVRPGWLSAVMAGHQQVAAGLSITAPVLLLTSDKTIIGTRWSEDMRAADVVLDVDLMTRRALQLGEVVTVVRVPGAIHDVTLSAAPARARAYAELRRWTRAYVAPGA
ncbi:alpha/beta hydrolase [Georgenia sp. MJ206]|uniref:alpha/beta hydrolase n=1 Tax=Georgenia wangjunii TaxID=3117730 RepID=UPI002F266E95